MAEGAEDSEKTAAAYRAAGVPRPERLGVLLRAAELDALERDDRRRIGLRSLSRDKTTAESGMDERKRFHPAPGGPNINGPALIRAPSWPSRRLGTYYLYFAQHRGGAIWLAVADVMTGPWRIHPDPVLTLAATHYSDHIASPDVIVDSASREVRMYFHGGDGTELNAQTESLAIGDDGVTFRLLRRDIGTPYWRVFRHAAHWYALVMPGTIVRSDDGLAGFEPVAEILPRKTRHSAVAVVGNRALVLYSMIGGRPESILGGWLDLTRECADWRLSDPAKVLEPAGSDEGGSLPPVASLPGQCEAPARELRDPALCADGNTLYLAYAAGGERCLALAAMHVSSRPH